MLNRTGWRYLSSRPLRRAAPHALAVVRRAGAPAWLLTRQSAATNPAPCGCLFFFFRRFDRHASSGSSPSQRDSLSPAADRSRGERETSPLKASSPTESSHVTDVGDDGELEDASADMPPAESLSWKERAKTFAVEYGRVGIATHIVLSVVSISVIYGAISSGVDVSGLLHSLGISPDSAGKESAATSAGSFILAYAVYKVAAPLRWPLTFAVTPVVMRALRRRGYMLPKTKSNAHRSPRPEAEDAAHGDDHGASRK